MSPNAKPEPKGGSAGIEVLPTSRSPKRRRVRALVVIALVAIAGLAWWVRHDRFQPQSVPLATGGRLTLVAVDGDRVHYSPFDPFWRRCVDVLPASWRTRWSFQGTDSFPRDFPPGFQQQAKELAMWFAFSTNGSNGDLVARIEDDAGRTFGNTHQVDVRSTRDGRLYTALTTRILPRRSEWLRIVVGDRADRIGNLGTFRVRNPLYAPKASAFLADAVPQTARDGDLAVTLESLVVTTNNPGLVDAEGPIARATFSVTHGGRINADWRPTFMAIITDATGNRLPGGTRSGPRDPLPARTLDFRAIPGNEAWWMEVEFLQFDGLATNEVWRLRALPIALGEGQPSAGHSGITTRLRGKELKVAFLGIDGRREWSANDVPGEVHAILRLFSPLDNDPMPAHIVVLRAVDDRGREVTPRHPIGQYGDFRFDLSPGATAMDLDIAFTERRTVWFAARATPVAELPKVPESR